MWAWSAWCCLQDVLRGWVGRCAVRLPFLFGWSWCLNLCHTLFSFSNRRPQTFLHLVWPHLTRSYLISYRLLVSLFILSHLMTSTLILSQRYFLLFSILFYSHPISSHFIWYNPLLFFIKHGNGQRTGQLPKLPCWITLWGIRWASFLVRVWDAIFSDSPLCILMFCVLWFISQVLIAYIYIYYICITYSSHLITLSHAKLIQKRACQLLAKQHRDTRRAKATRDVHAAIPQRFAARVVKQDFDSQTCVWK